MKLHESALTQINFVLENLTAINGAMRLVPGSHRLKQNPPNLLQDWNGMGSMRSNRVVSSAPGARLDALQHLVSDPGRTTARAVALLGQFYVKTQVFSSHDVPKETAHFGFDNENEVERCCKFRGKNNKSEAGYVDYVPFNVGK